MSELSDQRGISEHKHVSGEPGQSTFPESWSADKIMHEISDLTTYPRCTWHITRLDLDSDLRK